MEDQLGALERLGIKAAKLNASSSKTEVNEVQKVRIFLYFHILIENNVIIICGYYTSLRL